MRQWLLILLVGCQSVFAASTAEADKSRIAALEARLAKAEETARLAEQRANFEIEKHKLKEELQVTKLTLCEERLRGATDRLQLQADTCKLQVNARAAAADEQCRTRSEEREVERQRVLQAQQNTTWQQHVQHEACRSELHAATTCAQHARDITSRLEAVLNRLTAPVAPESRPHAARQHPAGSRTPRPEQAGRLRPEGRLREVTEARQVTVMASRAQAPGPANPQVTPRPEHTLPRESLPREFANRARTEAPALRPQQNLHGGEQFTKMSFEQKTKAAQRCSNWHLPVDIIKRIGTPVTIQLDSKLHKVVPSHNTKTWHEARSACNEIGMELLEIDSEMKQNRVTKIISEVSSGEEAAVSSAGYWLGASSEGRASYDMYTYVGSGRVVAELDYTRWNPGEPEPSETNRCVFLSPDNFKWRNHRCAMKLHFVCECSQ